MSLDDMMKVPKGLPDHIGVIWKEMLPQVRPTIGAAGMEALCTQVYRMRDAQKRITAEGIVVADAKGNPCPHPALAVEKQAQGEVRAWLGKYGRR
jgi:hypothetical protein